MRIYITKAKQEDKDFIIKANNEINVASNLHDTTLSNNIDNDLFGKNKKCFCLIAKENNRYVGMCLYSNIYWANLGQGIYLSQVYIEPIYRQMGFLKMFIDEIKDRNSEAKFITCLVGEENDRMAKSFDKIGGKKLDLGAYYINLDK